MRHKATFVFAMAAALATIAPVGAQAQDKRVHVSLGGGWTAPNSEVGDRFGQGYNFNLGVDIAINPVISIEGLYSFNGLGEKNITLPVTPEPVGTGGVPTQLFSSMNMQYGTGSVFFQKPDGNV
jgi:hypothetical protein